MISTSLSRISSLVLACWMITVFRPLTVVSANEGESTALVVSIEGQVSVKRIGWTNYAPVVFGTELQAGDLLRAQGSAIAQIVCSDLTLHEIREGIKGVPCAKSRPLLQRPDGSVINITRSRSPADGSVPLVLSPRKTKLFSLNPVLRWTAVPGATSYNVIVRGSSHFWASTVSSVTELQYPEYAPRLVPNEDYKLIVETNGLSSSVEPGAGLGFSVLGQKERKGVAQKESAIKSLGLAAGPTEYLIAHLYTTYGLKAEAIERLDSISHDFRPAAIARLLGDLYLSVGLDRQAEINYVDAIRLSKKESDQIGEMLAHLALARIYEQGLGNNESARDHFGAALALAKQLGDNYTANQARGKRLDSQ